MDATPNQPQVEAIGVEAAEPLLGSDPWMRFDLWANRAWEASESAVRIATEYNGAISEDSMDNRVLASFHAAEIAKEFAVMVNPLLMSGGTVRTVTITPDDQSRAIMSMLLDDGDPD